MGAVEDFFRELDERWDTPAERRINLHVIGSAALMLQKDYVRGTKDSDIYESTNVDAETKSRLLALAGRDSEIHTRRRMYLDIVPSGIVFLPHVPNWLPLAALSDLRSFELLVLDVVDVSVSKLKRFNASDVDDIAAMIDGQHVSHADFVTRFKLAVTELAHTAHASSCAACIENFHEVERDIFVTEETEIDLPSWVD